MPLFVLAHFGHHLISALLQPLMPLIRDDFGLDYAQAGLIVSAYTLAYGFSQLPAGWLADKMGARMLITIGISGVAVTGILVGISPNYFLVAASLVIMGILGGGYHPAASPLVSASVEPEKRGRALGLHQIGGTASFFLTPIIAMWLANAFGGWRASFLTLSLITFAFGIGFYILLGRLTRNQPVQAAKGHTAQAAAPNHIGKLVAFMIIGICIQIATFSAISFTPLFAVDHLKTTKETGALLLAAAQFAGMWAGPVGGYLADRIGKVRVMLVTGLITGPAIFALSAIAADWTAYAALLVIGTCQYVAMPVSESYIISHAPAEKRSTILGFYYFASRGGPGLLVPAIGFLADWRGFNLAFTAVGAGILVIVLLCSAFLWNSKE